MESRERLLKSEEKKLLKERIAKLFYNEKGEPRFLGALMAGVICVSTGVSLLVGLLYGMGRMIIGVTGISQYDSISICGSGAIALSALMIVTVLFVMVGGVMLETLKERRK